MARDRGVTVALQYALVLGVVTLLTTGLLASVGAFVEDRHEGVVRAELEVVGERAAADLVAADRLVRTDGERVRVRSDLPARVAGTDYRVEVVRVDARRYELRLRTSDPDVTATVAVRSDTPVETGTVDGGPLRFRYDPEAGVLEVERG